MDEDDVLAVDKLCFNSLHRIRTLSQEPDMTPEKFDTIVAENFVVCGSDQVGAHRSFSSACNDAPHRVTGRPPSVPERRKHRRHLGQPFAVCASLA